MSLLSRLRGLLRIAKLERDLDDEIAAQTPQRIFFIRTITTASARATSSIRRRISTARTPSTRTATRSSSSPARTRIGPATNAKAMKGASRCWGCRAAPAIGRVGILNHVDLHDGADRPALDDLRGGARRRPRPRARDPRKCAHSLHPRFQRRPRFFPGKTQTGLARQAGIGREIACSNITMRRCVFAMRRPTRWAWSITRIFWCGSRWAAWN